jgi:hypothetical protein
MNSIKKVGTINLCHYSSIKPDLCYDNDTKRFFIKLGAFNDYFVNLSKMDFEKVMNGESIYIDLCFYIDRYCFSKERLDEYNSQHI